MNDSQHPVLTREQIREAFVEHRGEQLKLARALGVSETTVSEVLRGRTTSKRVYRAAQARALELLSEERDGKAAA
jgi:plasmid maintenance system antidote protein VapI